MEPVVNGINEAYGDNIDFRKLNVNTTDGGAAFKYFKLIGHPAYVVLNPDGQVLWSGIGEKSEDELVQQITAIMPTP
jgi:hypothetical protein